MGHVCVGKLSLKRMLTQETTTICHCTDCQINSGTAFGYVVGAINDSFNLLKGELSFYIKLADSGTKRELAFFVESVEQEFMLNLKMENLVFLG